MSSSDVPVAIEILALLELMVIKVIMIVQWMIVVVGSSIPPAVVNRGVWQTIQVIDAVSIEIAGKVLEVMIVVV